MSYPYTFYNIVGTDGSTISAADELDDLLDDVEDSLKSDPIPLAWILNLRVQVETGADITWLGTVSELLIERRDRQAARERTIANQAHWLSIVSDRHGNTSAESGCDRCECGCKYWENDRCIDCDTAFNPIRHKYQEA